jgi:hypothetical protein
VRKALTPRSKEEVLEFPSPLLKKRQLLIWSPDRHTKNERKKRSGKRKMLSMQNSSSFLTRKISKHRKRASLSASQDLRNNLLKLTRAWIRLLRLS